MTHDYRTRGERLVDVILVPLVMAVFLIMLWPDPTGAGKVFDLVMFPAIVALAWKGELSLVDRKELKLRQSAESLKNEGMQ